MPDIWKLMRAIRKSDLSAPERHTLLTLTSLVDPKTGLIPERFQPSLTDLTRFTKLGRSTIARSLNAAEEGGWIKRTVPNKKAAQMNKEKTNYLLLIPADALDEDDEDPDGASATVGLVPEGDQLGGWCQGGTSATAGLELVPPWDGASATVGHVVPEPCVPVNQPPPSEGEHAAVPTDLFGDQVKTAAKARTERRPAARKRMSRVITKNTETLPSDWCVSDEMAQWAKEKAPDVISRLATERFLVYFGEGGKKKKDWDATWRNWILGDQQHHEQRNGTSGTPSKSANSNYQGRRGGSQHVPYRDPDDISAYKRSKI